MRLLLVGSGLCAFVAAGASIAAASDFAGPRGLIDRIYMPYVRGQQADHAPPRTRALDAAYARLTSGDSDVGLDFDPYCDCQDVGRFSYRVRSIVAQGRDVVARVAIRNRGEAKTIVLRMRREDGVWRVADIGEGAGSLLQSAGAAPGR